MLSLALPIQDDPRTGRQVEALAQKYDVTVVGFGTPSPSWAGITWHAVAMRTPRWRRMFEMGLLLLGRLWRGFYDVYFWTRPRYRECLKFTLESQPEVMHASDWAMLPIAIRAADQTGARIVYDADEYWPLLDEDNRRWRLFFAPLIDDVHRQTARRIDRAITVSRPIAERYKQEYGFDSIVLYNAPDFEEPPPATVDPTAIRLIHHGAPQANRQLERLVETMPLLDERFSLHFLLGDSNPAYVEQLRELGQRLAPGRVHFLTTVPYSRVVSTIARFDIELCYVAPVTFTYEMTLPNKLFEAHVAGLAVLTGPSPAMAEMVRLYRTGWVAPGYAPQDLAAVLNAVTPESLFLAKENARRAARQINASTERARLQQLYVDLLAETPSP